MLNYNIYKNYHSEITIQLNRIFNNKKAELDTANNQLVLKDLEIIENNHKLTEKLNK